MQYRLFNVLAEFGTNTYLLWDEKSREAAMIDPAYPAAELLTAVGDLELKYIINTHGHGDHIGGNELIKENSKAQLIIHELDAPMLIDPKKNLSTYWEAAFKSPEADLLLKDGDQIMLGNKPLKIIHTPGHTKGGICILADDLLFSGDTLFCESIGRTDLPGGDYPTLISSIENKLFQLDGEVKVLPGHGPETTIEDEKVGNPFVGMLAK